MRTEKEIDELFSTEDLSKKVIGMNRWWHVIKLGSKIVTPGKYDSHMWESILNAIPKDLTGKSILDVGTRDGGFAFECEKRNAKEIVAFDVWDKSGLDSQHIEFCKEVLGSKVQPLKMDVMNVETLKKKFDLVLFLGVYYHLMNPFLAIQKLYNICNEMMIFEGIILESESSICYFLEPGEIGGDTSNTFAFSPTFLVNYAKAVGFQKIEFMGYERKSGQILKSNEKFDRLRVNRGIFHLWK